MALADKQSTVAGVLEKRLSKADNVTDDGTRDRYLCPACGETHERARFGVRKMERKALLVEGKVQTLDHWHVLSVGTEARRGRVKVVIQVRQSQCRACRSLLTPGVTWDAKNRDSNGLGPNGSRFEIPPIPGTEEQRVAWWERWERSRA